MSTFGTSVRLRSAHAKEVFNSQPLDLCEAVALRPRRIEIVVFERTPVAEQLLVRLTVVECWLAQFTDPACLQRLLDFRIGTEGSRPIAQREVDLHVGQRR